MEDIPAELWILILRNISDFETLRSIVLASPACHRAYLIVRQDILLNFVKQRYDQEALAEAIVAVRSKGVYAENPENREKIVALLDCYRPRSSTQEIIRESESRKTNEPTSLEEMVELLHLHKVATFFLQDFCLHAPCPPWIESAKWIPEIFPLTPNDIEKGKFLRAIYRLQTYCNIFGAPEHFQTYPGAAPFPRNKWREARTFSDVEVRDLCFAGLPVWELRPLNHIWIYLRDKYVAIFQEIYI